MICPVCKHRNPKNMNFCLNCGAALRPPAPAQPQYAPSAPRQRGMVGWYTLAGVAAVVICGGVLFLGRLFSTPKVVQTFSPPPVAVNQSQMDPVSANPTATQNTSVLQQPAIPETSTQPALQIPSEIFTMLPNVNVMDFDSFDQLSATRWVVSTTGVELVSGGQARITAARDFSNYLVYVHAISSGQAVFAQFQLTGNQPSFEMFLHQGDWQTTSYRRYGLGIWDEPAFLLNMWKGADFIGGPEMLNGSLTPRSGQWYDTLMGVSNGDFFLYLWETNDRANLVKHKMSLGNDWNHGDWKFSIQNGGGDLLLDNFAVVTFE